MASKNIANRDAGARLILRRLCEVNRDVEVLIEAMSKVRIDLADISSVQAAEMAHIDIGQAVDALTEFVRAGIADIKPSEYSNHVVITWKYKTRGFYSPVRSGAPLERL